MKRKNLRSLLRNAASLTTVGRHALAVIRGGQLRFRLETFGLYYPALPYSAPWWRFPRRNLIVLLGRMQSYAAWIIEMEEIRRSGAGGWWERHGRQEREDGAQGP